MSQRRPSRRGRGQRSTSAAGQMNLQEFENLGFDRTNNSTVELDQPKPRKNKTANHFVSIIQIPALKKLPTLASRKGQNVRSNAGPLARANQLQRGMAPTSRPQQHQSSLDSFQARSSPPNNSPQSSKRQTRAPTRRGPGGLLEFGRGKLADKKASNARSTSPVNMERQVNSFQKPYAGRKNRQKASSSPHMDSLVDISSASAEKARRNPRRQSRGLEVDIPPTPQHIDLCEDDDDDDEDNAKDNRNDSDSDEGELEFTDNENIEEVENQQPQPLPPLPTPQEHEVSSDLDDAMTMALDEGDSKPQSTSVSSPRKRSRGLMRCKPTSMLENPTKKSPSQGHSAPIPNFSQVPTSEVNLQDTDDEVLDITPSKTSQAKQPPSSVICVDSNTEGDPPVSPKRKPTSRIVLETESESDEFPGTKIKQGKTKQLQTQVRKAMNGYDSESTFESPEASPVSKRRKPTPPDQEVRSEPPTSSLPPDLQAGVFGKALSAIARAKTLVGRGRAAGNLPHQRDGSDSNSSFVEENNSSRGGKMDVSQNLREVAESMEDANINERIPIPRKPKTSSPMTFQLTKANSKNQLSTHSKPVQFAQRKSSRIRAKAPTKIRPGASFLNQQTKLSWRESSDDEFETPALNNSRRSRLKPLELRRVSPRIKKKQIPKSPEVYEIDDSDSEIEEVAGPPVWELELSRIAIGSKVFASACKALVNTGTHEIKLSYRMPRRKSRRRSQPDLQEHTLCLKDGNLKEWAFFISKNSQEQDSALQMKSFLSMQIMPQDSNGLSVFTKSYKPNATDESKKYIVLEFRHSHDLELIGDKYNSLLLSSGVNIKHLNGENYEEYAASLIQDNDVRKSQDHNAFLAGRDEDFTLLVYPFDEDPKVIETAAQGLNEASGDVGGDSDEEDEERPSETESNKGLAQSNAAKEDSLGESGDQSEEKEKTGRRAHFVTIRVEDVRRLDPGKWLNDSLLDFWMQWISRDDTQLSSKFHFFTSHFFSTLSSDGPQAVASWTKRKKINIFEKRFIFIPINKSLHWSLCVVVNPGAILERGNRQPERKDPLSCMILMDSLRMHNPTKISTTIRGWLNSEWKRVHSEVVESRDEIDPFSKSNVPLFNPRVPYQNNTWDCGVFVCRYAYALYELRHRNFTFEDAGMFCDRSSRRKGGVLQALISDSSEFDFNMDDIARFREEFKILIERLSYMYLRFKSSQKRQKHEQQQLRSDASGEESEAAGGKSEEIDTTKPNSTGEQDIDTKPNSKTEEELHLKPSSSKEEATTDETELKPKALEAPKEMLATDVYDLPPSEERNTTPNLVDGECSAILSQEDGLVNI